MLNPSANFLSGMEAGSRWRGDAGAYDLEAVGMEDSLVCKGLKLLNNSVKPTTQWLDRGKHTEELTAKLKTPSVVKI